MSTHTEISDLYFKAYIAGDIEDHELVQFIDQAMTYLGAKTIAALAARECVDYKVIKKRKKRLINPLNTFITGGVEFVIDND